MAGMGSQVATGRRWSRNPASVVLHALDWLTSRPLVALAVVAVDLVWVVVSARFEFPTRLESVFQTMVAAVTLAMVFVIQHTQAREQAATQRKLDEILRSLPEADKTMMALEAAPDQDLRQAARTHRDVREESLPEGARPEGARPDGAVDEPRGDRASAD